MARVQLENRLFSSPELKDLGEAIDMDPMLCVGILAGLWHYSQEKEIDHINAKQLNSCFSSFTPRVKKRIINGLIESQWLKLVQDDLYYIRGNQLKIKQIKGLKDSIKKAIDSRWSDKTDLEVTKKIQNFEKKAINDMIETFEQPIETIGTLFSKTDTSRISINNNKQITNKRKGIDLRSSRASEKGTTAGCQSTEIQASVSERKPSTPFELIDHWRKEFERRWKTQAPKPSKKDFGQAKQILSRCDNDLDSAKRLISHYFTRYENHYISSGHTLDLLQRDFNKLWAEMNTGTRITQNQIKRASILENNLEEGRKFLESDECQNPFDTLIEGNKQEANYVIEGHVEK